MLESILELLSASMNGNTSVDRLTRVGVAIWNRQVHVLAESEDLGSSCRCLVDTGDSEEKWRVTVVRVDASDTGWAGNPIDWALCEVVAGILNGPVELRLEAWFGGELSCDDRTEQLCSASAEIA